MKNLLFSAAAILLMLTACSSKNGTKTEEVTKSDDPDKTDYVEMRKDSAADLEFLGYKVNELNPKYDNDYDKAPVKYLDLASGKKMKMKCFPFIREYNAPNRYAAYNADANKEQITDVLNTFIDKYGAFTYCFSSIGNWVKDINWGAGGRYHPAMWFAEMYAGHIYDKVWGFEVDTVPDYSYIKNALYYSNYFKKLNSNKEALKAIMADADASLSECIRTEMYGYAEERTYARRPFMTFVWEWKNQAAEVMVSHDVVCVTYINAGYDFRKVTGRLLSEDEQNAELKDYSVPFRNELNFELMSRNDMNLRIADPNLRPQYVINSFFGDITNAELTKSIVKDIFARQSKKEIRVVVTADEDKETVEPVYDISYDGKTFNTKRLIKEWYGKVLPDIK